MKPIVLLVVAAALFAVAWMCWPPPVQAPPLSRPDPGSPTEAAAMAVPASDRAPVPVPEEFEVPTVARVDASASPMPTRALVAPWLLRILVVAEDGFPVPQATITIRAAVGDGATRSSEPPFALVTDPSGRVQTTSTEPVVFVTAAKPDVGESGAVRVVPGASGTETKLVLERALALRGRVLRNDGLPAVGARVVALVVGSSRRDDVSPPEGVLADADGAFALPVRKNVVYDVRAELYGRNTLVEQVWVDSEDPAAINLVFTGAISLRGIVLDERRMPVAGADVKAWREVQKNRPEDHEGAAARTDDDGRFDLSVARHARYQLVASADGHANAAPEWVEPSATRPVVDTVLHLRAMSSIRGRLLGPDSRPIAGSKMYAKPEQGDQVGWGTPARSDLFGRGASATTGVDGGFRFAAHPDTTYTIVTWPVADSARLEVRRSGIPPGVDDLEIRCSADELVGCTVQAVVTRADGAALGLFRVRLVQFEDENTKHIGDLPVRVTDDGFFTPTLPFGARIALHVSLGADQQAAFSGPLAPAFVGPFLADRRQLTLHFKLDAWAEVPLRVLDAAGNAANKVRAVVRSRQAYGVYDNPMPVEAEGQLVAKRLLSGPADVVVYGAKGMLCQQELLVTPGRNSEVVVRLPSASTQPR